VVFDDGPPSDFFYVEVHGYRFVPLVTRSHALVADIEVHLGTRGKPGEIIHGGDLDNRLKNVFDALRMPQHGDELGRHPRGDGQERVYCLLEDDSLIARVEIITYQLFGPPKPGYDLTDVHLGMDVYVESGAPRLGNITF
jgi:hypothetical protein